MVSTTTGRRVSETSKSNSPIYTAIELRHLKRGFKKHDNELTRTEFVDL